jgi:hypothetical protein
MRKDRFTDEALAAAKALAELKYSENPEDQLAYAEAYDFARCQRPDGSFYGTSGQCRKGTPAGEKQVEPKAPRAAKKARPSKGSPGADKQVAKDKKPGKSILEQQVAADARAITNKRAFDTTKGEQAYDAAKKRMMARMEKLGKEPGKQHVKATLEELRNLEKKIGTVGFNRRLATELLRALVVNDKKAAKEAAAKERG